MYDLAFACVTFIFLLGAFYVIWNYNVAAVQQGTVEELAERNAAILDVLVRSPGAPDDWEGLSWQEDRNLYAHWRLNESSGGSAQDDSGYGNDGTLVNSGAGTDWVGGKLNNALKLDGKTDYVNFGNPPQLDFDGDFSIAMWVSSSVDTNTLLGGWRYLIRHKGKYEIGFYNDELTFKPKNNSGEYFPLTSPLVMLEGVWHLLVFVKDGADLMIYIDGDLNVGRSGFTGTLSAADNNLTLGGKYDASWSNFDGTFDEALIYESALSGPDVSALWNMGNGTESPAGAGTATNPDVIGLAERDRVLDADKVAAFAGLASADYDSSKALLKTAGYDYLFELDGADDLNIGRQPAVNVYKVRLRRIVTYKEDVASVALTLYTPG